MITSIKRKPRVLSGGIFVVMDKINFDFFVEHGIPGVVKMVEMDSKTEYRFRKMIRSGGVRWSNRIWEVKLCEIPVRDYKRKGG